MDSKGYLGIDVSKGYADFILLGSNSKVLVKSFQLMDTTSDRKKLCNLIAEWQNQGLEELYCGVESTGGYENNWYALLKGLQSSQNIFVSRLNARGVKAVSDGELRRTITDSVSAEDIALYLIKFPEKVDYGINYVPDEKFIEGRNQITALNMHIKQKGQLSSQLEKWLYGSFPEMLVYCRNGIPDWLLKMLQKYPTPQKVARTRGGLVQIQGISKGKATSIKAKAKKNEQRVSPEMGHLIASHAREILHKRTVVKDEEAYLVDVYKNEDSVKLLTTIPGVGISSAVKMILEIEDINRFDTAKKMASYFGVHPTFKQSGDGMWGSHMSKKGRPEMRSILYMCALTGSRCNPVLKPIYSKCRHKGMGHNEALGVIMHKILRIVFGMLKSGKKFNPKIDKKNQERASRKQKEKEQRRKEEKKKDAKSKRRFQEIMDEAPVSGRNAAKRKKQMASQTSEKEVYAGLPSADTKI